ncbi:protein stand still [Scaptodrosophila lebanonensis]|uniref:Protein stand still n=1 Tax=Drosophila lebanonensis TaxID=7225 RepID=A0A6J2UEN0_DROLE|nr:protein stand still [Scaptodrosophila lebanonensis]
MTNKIKALQNKVNEAKLELDETTIQHIPYILNGELFRIESQIGDNVTVKCCHCPPERIYRGSVRSTGNFHMHIKRRHASLLGKLHEMKVAALVERRDRIIKNRALGVQNRKKSSTASGTAVDEPAAIKVENNHELKIKTVFQRHQQEYQQEEAAAMRSGTTACDSLLEKTNQTNKTDTNNNIKHLLQDVRNLPNLNPALVSALITNQNGSVTMPTTYNPSTSVGHAIGNVPRYLPFNVIKPEQNAPLHQDSEAIDLSTGSMSGDDKERSANTLQEPQSTLPPQLSPYVSGMPRDILLFIDKRLNGIRQELQMRNQIEQKRLLLEAAKFKFLHPEFHFETFQ